MSNNNYEIVLKHSCELGESPVWDQERKSIIWVDIVAGKIYQYNIISSEFKSLSFEEEVGAVTLCSSGRLLVALNNRLVFVERDTGVVDLAEKNPKISPGYRYNDGKCDPAGRFWLGTMNKFGVKKVGSLFTIEKDLTTSTKINNVTVSNGMAWSLNYDVFYYIDTAEQNVVAYNYDINSGTITNRKVIIEVPKKEGKPDGMTIDEEGMLWIALWGGGNVSRWNPNTGECIYKINLPASLITSCMFGGKELDELYVTSAKVGLSEAEIKKQPLAGSLFVVKNTGYKGVPMHKFSG